MKNYSFLLFIVLLTLVYYYLKKSRRIKRDSNINIKQKYMNTKSGPPIKGVKPLDHSGNIVENYKKSFEEDLDKINK